MVLYWEGSEPLGGAVLLEDVGGSLKEGPEHPSPCLASSCLHLLWMQCGGAPSSLQLLLARYLVTEMEKTIKIGSLRGKG